MLTVYVVCTVPGNTKMSEAEPLPWMKFYFLESLLMSPETKTKLTVKWVKMCLKNQNISR